MKTIFESSVAGREGCWPCDGMAEEAYIPTDLLRDGDIGLPSVSELDVVRHFTKLSQRNYSVDSNFYPLGSCTMKYNPKFTEVVAAMPGFTRLHPVLPQLQGAGGLCQGALEVMYETENLLAEITGMAAYTMHPMAGAHGELTGVMLMAAYHKDRGNKKTKVIVPDSAHGTNPASAAIAGYEIISIKSVDGIVNPDAPMMDAGEGLAAGPIGANADDRTSAIVVGTTPAGPIRPRHRRLRLFFHRPRPRCRCRDSIRTRPSPRPAWRPRPIRPSSWP